MAEEQKQGILDKASTANVVAALVILTGIAGSLYFEKWEVVTFILGAAVGYLFPKTQK